jgi:hypothetical protein
VSFSFLGRLELHVDAWRLLLTHYIDALNRCIRFSASSKNNEIALKAELIQAKPQPG